MSRQVRVEFVVTVSDDMDLPADLDGALALVTADEIQSFDVTEVDG